MEWSGSDADNDVLDYEVFMGVLNPPTTSVGITSETSISDISVQASTTYYWFVVSKDSTNNSSNSEIFDFKVE